MYPTQKILFDKDGLIIDSDDNLFSTTNMRDASILCHFPLVESILPQLMCLDAEETFLVFAGVESNYSDLRGIYDYEFVLKHSANDNAVIEWLIIDRTDTYKNAILQQQQSHEQEIKSHYNF